MILRSKQHKSIVKEHIEKQSMVNALEHAELVNEIAHEYQNIQINVNH